MYSALDIAKYIIDYSNRRDTPVSNLQLQKILYYIQMNFYRRLNKPAFNEDIEAWKYGPVVSSVYNVYCMYGASDICLMYPEVRKIFSGRESEIANWVIRACIAVGAWELVEKSHIKDGPWDKTYKGGLGDKKVIPKEEIIAYAVGKR